MSTKPTTELRPGDRVVALNANGRPMSNSTGTGTLTGVVAEVVSSDFYKVEWMNPGRGDRRRVFTSSANLRKEVAQ